MVSRQPNFLMLAVHVSIIRKSAVDIQSALTFGRVHVGIERLLSKSPPPVFSSHTWILVNFLLCRTVAIQYIELMCSLKRRPFLFEMGSSLQ